MLTFGATSFSFNGHTIAKIMARKSCSFDARCLFLYDLHIHNIVINLFGVADINSLSNIYTAYVEYSFLFGLCDVVSELSYREHSIPNQQHVLLLPLTKTSSLPLNKRSRLMTLIVLRAAGLASVYNC